MTQITKRVLSFGHIDGAVSSVKLELADMGVCGPRNRSFVFNLSSRLLHVAETGGRCDARNANAEDRKDFRAEVLNAGARHQEKAIAQASAPERKRKRGKPEPIDHAALARDFESVKPLIEGLR